MKNLILLIIGITVITMVSCKKEKADYIYVSGTVYTVNSKFEKVEAFAVKDGKISGTGTNEEILKKFDTENIIDLKGKFVYPGFNDAHCHFSAYGESLQFADLTGTNSIEQIIEILKNYQKYYNPKIILGIGWDQNDWKNKTFPDKKILDQNFPDIPVVLTRIDGHAIWVNSKAIELSGFTAKTKVSGGEIFVKNNRLTGILLDKAADSLKKFIPKPDKKQKTSYLLTAQTNCFKVGLTSVSDAGLEKSEILLIDELQKNKQLKMRIYAMLSPSSENMEYFVKKGIYKTEKLNVRSIKLYADGALGSRGAALLKPYSDMPENFGIITISQDEFDKFCALALKNNYQINTHAIGDSANRYVLNTYAKFLKQKNDLRWRIEHSQVVNENDFKLFGKYSIIPSVQPTHATSDMYWAEERLGNDRIKGAYAYKRLLEQNGWIPAGSDFPIESINPLFGFYAAVSRKDQSGFPENGFQTENALTREQALKAMTIWAAESTFDEKEKGSIETGKYADFVILENDIMTCPENEIFKTEVIKTFVKGEKVYDAEREK